MLYTLMDHRNDVKTVKTMGNCARFVVDAVVFFFVFFFLQYKKQLFTFLSDEVFGKTALSLGHFYALFDHRS